MKSAFHLLIRLLAPALARSVVWGMLFLLGSTQVFQAHAAKPLMGTVSVPSAQEVLEKSVKTWVSQTRSMSADQVTLQPLDPRLQVRSCDKPLVMDLPFSNPENVRVRCLQPVWQLYVRLNLTHGTTALNGKNLVVKRKILVAASHLSRGTNLLEMHVQQVEVDASNVPPNALDKMSDIQYTEMVRDVGQGVPLRSQDIRPIVLIKRGQMVLMSVGQPQGFQISARVEALQDGRYGEQIKLKNRDSGRQLSGLVQGPNVVQGL